MKCSTRPKTSLARARRVYGCRSRMVARVTVLSSRLQMTGIVQGVAAAIAAAALTAAALAAAEPAAALAAMAADAIAAAIAAAAIAAVARS